MPRYILGHSIKIDHHNGWFPSKGQSILYFPYLSFVNKLDVHLGVGCGVVCVERELQPWGSLSLPSK